MATRIRPSRLFWGLFLALSGATLALRLRAPGHSALSWLTAGLLGLLGLRVITLMRAWRQGHLPGTRVLLPAVVLVEGLGLVIRGSSHLAVQLRLGTALALELLLLALAIRALARARTQPGTWPEDRIAEAFEAFVPPPAARLMALELVMLGSALRFLLGGFRKPAPEGFSHHRESPLGSLLPVLPLLIPADMLLVHAIFPHMAPWLRWTLHGSTFYAVLWLIGFYALLKARPHQIRNGRVHLNLGLIKRVSFGCDQIRAAAPLPDFSDDWARHAHFKGMQKLVAAGPPVVELALSEPVQVAGLLGPSQPASRLAVSMDDPAAFLAALPCA